MNKEQMNTCRWRAGVLGTGTEAGWWGQSQPAATVRVREAPKVTGSQQKLSGEEGTESALCPLEGSRRLGDPEAGLPGLPARLAAPRSLWNRCLRNAAQSLVADALPRRLRASHYFLI